MTIFPTLQDTMPPTNGHARALSLLRNMAETLSLYIFGYLGLEFIMTGCCTMFGYTSPVARIVDLQPTS